MENNIDYLFIQKWMTDLFRPKEKGKSLDYIKRDIFAYIFSYSRDGVNKWYGKQQTLAAIVGCSESKICTKLKELVNDGLIIKEEVKLYGMFHHNNYMVNPEIIAYYSGEYTIDGEKIARFTESKPLIDGEKTNNKSIDNPELNNSNGIYGNHETPPEGVLETQESDIYKGAQSAPNAYIIPTIDDVKSYASKKGFFNVDINYFYEFYEAADWRNERGNPIKWKQKLLQWEHDESSKPKGRRKKYTNIPRTEITMEYAGEHNEL